MSTAGGTPSGTPKSRLHGGNANTMHDKLAVNALVGFGVKKRDLTTVSSSVKTEEVTSSAENNVSNAGHQHSIGSYVSVDELGDLGKLYQSPDNDHSK